MFEPCDTEILIFSAQNFDKYKSGPVVVMKNNQPEAVIVTADEFKRLSVIEEDYQLLSEALERMNDPRAAVLSQDEVLRVLELTREDIEAAEDIEFETISLQS